MKKLLSILIAVCVLFSLAVIPVSANPGLINNTTSYSSDDLIVNGGFEDGLDGWTLYDPRGCMSAVHTFYADAAGGNAAKTAINGDKTLYIDMPADSGKPWIGYIQQEVAVTRNTNYVLNFSWYDYDYANLSRIDVFGDTESGSKLTLTFPATGSTPFGGQAWQATSATFNSGEHDKIILRFNFHTWTSIQRIAIDNVTLRAAGHSYTVGFEDGTAKDVNVRDSAYTVTTEKAHEGTHSLKITSTSGNHFASMVFPVNPDRICGVVFWYYIETGKLQYASKLKHETGFDNYAASANKTQTLDTTGAWTRVVATNGAINVGSSYILELAFRNSVENATIYIDDIQFIYHVQSVNSITVANEEATFDTLTATADAQYYAQNYYEPITYQWQRSDDKSTWTDIDGATLTDSGAYGGGKHVQDSCSYALTSADAEKYLRVKITTDNNHFYSHDYADVYYSNAISVGDLIASKDIVIKNSSDTEVGALTDISDGTVKIGVAAKNISASAENVNAYFVIYDDEGSVCEFQKDRVAVSAEGTYSKEVTFTSLPAILTGYLLKVFIWDDNNKPIIGAN